MRLDRPSSAGCCKSCIQGTCAPRCGTARWTSRHSRCKGSIPERERRNKAECCQFDRETTQGDGEADRDRGGAFCSEETSASLPSSSDRSLASGTLQPEGMKRFTWTGLVPEVAGRDQDDAWSGEEEAVYLLIQLLPDVGHVAGRPQAHRAWKPEEDKMARIGLAWDVHGLETRQASSPCVRWIGGLLLVRSHLVKAFQVDGVSAVEHADSFHRVE